MISRHSPHDAQQHVPPPDARPLAFARTRMLSYDLLTGRVDEPTTHTHVPAPRRCHVIVRMHSRPIGAVDIHFDVTATADLATEITVAAWRELRTAILDHLHGDGVAPCGTSDELSALATKPITCSNPVGQTDGPLVTVAIATVNNPDACMRTITHVLDNSYPNFDVVVVENTPHPTSLKHDIANAFADSTRIRVVSEPRKGLSFARNRGLQEATGEIVAFTDDDVIVDRHWIDAIVGGFGLDDSIACVTGAIIASEIETPAQAWLEQYGGYLKGFRQMRYDLDQFRRRDPLYPYNAGRFGSGASIAFRRDALIAMGGFSTELGAGTPAHGGEDIDVLRRAITAGHGLLYEPAALMWHNHRRSYLALRTQMFRYGVGLSATITKWIIESPRTARDILRRLPYGLYYLAYPASNKNARKTGLFPKQLSSLEILGVLCGPFCYAKSRCITKRRNRDG